MVSRKDLCYGRGLIRPEPASSKGEMIMKERLFSIGGIFTALFSAACCIGPALAIAFGITGLGLLSRYAWMRPYLLTATFVLTGLAYHYVYGRGSGKCGPGGECKPGSRRVQDRINKALFWALAAFALFGVVFPYVAEWLLI